MKFLLALALSILPIFALQNGDFTGSNYLSFTGPAVSLTNYRVEGRLSGFTIAGTQGVFGANVNGPHCLLVSGSITLRCRDFTGAGDTVDISLTGRTDIRFRFQRFYSTGVRLLEVWNADGTNYTSNSITNAVGTIAFNGTTQYVGAYYGAGSECDCVLGFIRWWSTTVAAASSAPPDTLLLGYADLVDLELEGNTTDSSGRSISITTTGGALSYATTTLYAPSAVITISGAARAGSTYSLSASTSSNLTTDSTLLYFWQAPVWTTAAPTFSSRTTVSPTVTVPTTQTVTIRLVVTDGIGQTGTSDATLGAVATDAGSVVIQSDSTLASIIGVNLRSGASPWTWFDLKEKAIADALIATIPAAPGANPAAGTVSVTSGSTALTGSGTTFLSTFACNGGDFITLLYPLAVGTGRRAYRVTACATNTAATLEVAYDAPSTPASPTGVQYQQLSGNDYAYWQGSSNNWNYYDAVAGFYRLYYRTGDTTYRDAARNLADKWWLYPYDGGRAWEYVQGSWMLNPRVAGGFGLMLRANDGQSSYWTGIMNQLGQQYGTWLSGYYPYQPNQNIGEIREQGYVFLYAQTAAILHPTGATRTTWQTNSNSARDYFIANQTAYGGWAWSLDASQHYYGSGNFPWQGFALMQALRLNYEAVGSTTAKASLKAYIDYLITEGIDTSNDGGYYEDSHFTWCPDYPAERTGTVTATNGSTTITGSGTLFQTQYACNGTDTIAIEDSGGFRRGYTVSSCPSQTSMTIAATYGGPTESGRRILKYAGVATTPPSACHTSYGTISSDMSAARTLLNGIHWALGWAYTQYGTSSYLTTGDRIFAQNLGLGGTGNDGTVGHYADVISGGSAPSYLALTYLSKEYAFVGGAPGSQSYLAARLGGVTPLVTTNITAYGRRADITSATKLRVTITIPSGTTYTNTCSADSCIVSSIDRRQGNGLMKIEFLSAGDVVLAASEQQPVTIP